MRAVTWQGRESVRVDDVDDARVLERTDAVVRVSASGLCGSDLHLYRHLIPGLDRGDVLGHEAVGVVEAAGADVAEVRPGDRVVIPFNVACGRCPMCRRGLQSQCETTQNTRFHRGGSLFGYTEQYGDVPGCQAELVRVPFADANLWPIPADADPTVAVLLADVLPTAWQGVAYADPEPGSTVAVFGLGPIGQAVARIALRRGVARVLGLDLVDERLAMAARHGVEALDVRTLDDVPGALVETTEGRGPDAVVDCVGMEAEGSALDSILQATRVQPSRAIALRHAIDAVRRGGTLSIVGVYAGPVQAFPLDQLFDKQVQVRMGQANVRRWLPDVAPLALDPADPLGLRDIVTHTPPLEGAPDAYEMFQAKRDGAVKVVFDLRPEAA
ncbi:MAG TPA: alcohol dehydrogenase catalytic domain-containing protein [Actinomycetota bacterium]